MGFWLRKVGSLGPQEMFKNPIVASDPPASQELNDALGRWNPTLRLLLHSLFWENDGIGGHKIGGGRPRNLPHLFLCCSVSHISLNPGADAFPDPKQDCQEHRSITAKVPAHSESREDKYALSCCRASFLKHVIHALSNPGSRRDEWGLVHSYARDEGSGT